jgi:hypothetical protein
MTIWFYKNSAYRLSVMKYPCRQLVKIPCLKYVIIKISDYDNIFCFFFRSAFAVHSSQFKTSLFLPKGEKMIVYLFEEACNYVLNEVKS